jgi:hypothetical protein
MSHFVKAKPIDAMKHFALFLLALILFWEGKIYWGDRNIYLQIPDK